MSLPLPQDAWKLVVNANYQDVMKTLMSLTTASLVLPFLFIRNFLGVPEGKRLADFLPSSAYWFWGFLLFSLLCDMIFFWASAKFIKVVSGGPEAPSKTLVSWAAKFIKFVSFGRWNWPKKLLGLGPEAYFETLRDRGIGGAVGSFVAALIAFSMIVWKVLHARPICG